MVAVADQFISIFIGMYLEHMRYWSTVDPDCTGGFVVCLPWSSDLTEIDVQMGDDFRAGSFIVHPSILTRL